VNWLLLARFHLNRTNILSCWGWLLFFNLAGCVQFMRGLFKYTGYAVGLLQ